MGGGRDGKSWGGLLERVTSRHMMLRDVGEVLSLEFRPSLPLLPHNSPLISLSDVGGLNCRIRDGKGTWDR